MQPALSPSGGWLNGPPHGAAPLTLLHVWALSCSVCKGQLPRVVRWQSMTGVELISVHTPITESDADPAAVTRLASAHGLTAPIALDEDGAIADALGVRALPAYVALNAQGRVMLRAAGAGADRQVESLLAREAGLLVS